MPRAKAENSIGGEDALYGEDRLLRALILAHSGLIASFERSVGLHMSRWRVLQVASRHKVCPQGELRRLTVLDPASITRILKEFEREGVIERTEDANDARQSLVIVTPKGRQMVRRIQKARVTYLEKAFRGLSAGDLARLEQMLNTVEGNLRDL
jgi:DNA-binding MarR family transcriptional regulator